MFGAVGEAVGINLPGVQHGLFGDQPVPVEAFADIDTGTA